LLITYT